MWSYDKRLQFPVKIKNPNPQTAKIVISQLGGPDGELGASMRYLNQRYAMPYKECKGIFDGHRHGRTCAHGDDLRYRVPADAQSHARADQGGRL